MSLPQPEIKEDRNALGTLLMVDWRRHDSSVKMLLEFRTKHSIEKAMYSNMPESVIIGNSLKIKARVSVSPENFWLEGGCVWGPDREFFKSFAGTFLSK